MHFTKLFYVFAVILAMYFNMADAGQQAGKVAQNAAKTAGQFAKNVGGKAPPVVIMGYSSNSTFNANVNRRSPSPKGKRN